jgi:Arc/MetJ-type ribon-helix-helix transcriptional regulator
MTISLSPQTQKLLNQQMEKGHFSSADDALRVALEALDQLRETEEMDQQTQSAIARAFEQSARGEGRPWPEVREVLTIRRGARRQPRRFK